VKGTYLAVLEIIKQDVEAFTLDTIFLHNNTRAANDLARITLLVNFAKASPGTKYFGIADLDEVDLVLSTESLNQFDVFSLGAGLN
jgi:hypothetical protein